MSLLGQENTQWKDPSENDGYPFKPIQGESLLDYQLRLKIWREEQEAAKFKKLAELVDQKKETSTGAIKNDAADAKIQLELFPPAALYAISTVFTYGAAKYDDWNWAKGLKYSRLYGALQRHLYLWIMGQNTDPETGFSHLWHAGCNIAMLIHTEMLNKPELDDRPKAFHSIGMQDTWQSILKKSESYKAVLEKKLKPQL